MKSKFPIVLLLIITAAVTGLFAQQKSNAETEWDNGRLKFISNDGNFAAMFDVRMFINGAYFLENKNELSNGTHLRKARFAMKTKLWKTWNVEWDIDVAEGAVEAKDMFVNYIGMENSHLKIGHFKMPLGLNELTSSRYQTFIERAYPMLAFEIDRRVGVEYSRWGERWNVRAAFFGQTMDTEKNKTIDETGGGVAIRVAALPVKTEDLTVHTGLALDRENPDDDLDAVKFQSEPECKIGDVEILDTGYIFDVDYITKIGLEGAATYKNYSFQSEYVKTDLTGMRGAKDAAFDGGYAFVSWVITGERKQWDATQGEFGPIIPKDNKKGAWELAFRYSYLNLSDADAGILGGKANNYTFGVNWYANPNIRFLVNYTYVDNSVYATGEGFIGNDDFGIIHAMIMAYF